MKFRFLTYIGILSLIFIVFFYFKSREAKGEIALFYPESCLGFFVNSEIAGILKDQLKTVI